MSHAPKIVSLAAALLLFAGGISLAAPPEPGKPISPSQGQPIPIVAAKRPDLVPKEGWSTGVGISNFSCTFGIGNQRVLITGVIIFNDGDTDVGASFKVEGKTNGRPWSESPITVSAWMPPKGSTNILHTEIVGPGTYTAWVKADSENAIAEKNESNNEATKTTTCN
ncbi:MAG: CARDB domain-containing protein [Candidatus Methylomirabilis sp.]